MFNHLICVGEVGAAAAVVVLGRDEPEPERDGVDRQADDQPEADGLDEEPVPAVTAHHLLEAVGHHRVRAGPRTHAPRLIRTAIEHDRYV